MQLIYLRGFGPRSLLFINWELEWIALFTFCASVRARLRSRLRSSRSISSRTHSVQMDQPPISPVFAIAARASSCSATSAAVAASQGSLVLAPFAIGVASAWSPSRHPLGGLVSPRQESLLLSKSPDRYVRRHSYLGPSFILAQSEHTHTGTHFTRAIISHHDRSASAAPSASVWPVPLRGLRLASTIRFELMSTADCSVPLDMPLGPWGSGGAGLKEATRLLTNWAIDLGSAGGGQIGNFFSHKNMLFSRE
jgi:hypothetical protein